MVDDEIDEELEEPLNNGIRIGLSGLPGAGKTAALLRVIRQLEARGEMVGGMVTDEIEEAGHRVGFKVTDWMSKEEGVLASVEYSSTTEVEGYGVDIDALNEIGVKAIERAIDQADVVVIDEIGKMESESDAFIAAVKHAMDSRKNIIMTMHKKSRNPLLQNIRKRDDVRIIEVTPVNKNILPYKIERLLEGEY